MRSRVSLPVLVLAVLAALLIGSVGSATASGLTTKSVKKIAAKVVKKSAPGLSVAHATTADSATAATNATNLQGRPASDYQNPARRFTLTVEAQAASRIYTFPGLPAGSYLVGYSVFGSVNDSGAPLSCQLRASASSPWANFSGSSAYQPFNPTTQGTALLELTSAPPQLSCTATGSTFAIYSSSNYLSTVTFTRVDGITSQFLTSTRPAGDTAPAQDAR